MDTIKKINKTKVIWEILRKIKKDELEQILELAIDSYYNNGISLITDENYDILLDRLKELNPKSKIFKQIGAPPKGKKVNLKYHLGSENKLKTEEEIENFSNVEKGPYVVMGKLDGVSGLETQTKNSDGLFTRGNGTIGVDVTHLTRLINMKKNDIPEKFFDKYEDIDTRGEIIMSKPNFAKYADIMANARNMVAGIVNSKPGSINKSHAKNVDYVVYQLFEPSDMKPSEQLELAKKMGFNVVIWDVYPEISIDILDDILKKWKKKYEYEIDGLVVRPDRVYKKNISGNPDYSFAYKGKTETANTKVIDVVWKGHKDGHLIPKILYKPVKLSGATLNKTAGFNARFIEDNNIGPGAIIEIVRSGDTIPYVKNIIKPAKKISFPDDEYEWDKNEVNIVLVNKEDNHDVIVSRLTKFVVDIGVENMAEETVRRLVDNGYDTIMKIVKLKKSDLLELDGFKQTKTDKIIKSLDTQLKNIDILTLMVASNCFGRGFGKRQTKKILDVYPNIVDTYDQSKRKAWTKKLLDIHGFDIISVDKFLDGLPLFQEFYEDFTKVRPVAGYIGPIIKKNGIFVGQNIVFTGFRKANWKEYIESEGGKVGQKPSGNTTLLVYNDGDISSSSYKKAIQLKIPVITQTKFASKYNLED